MNDLERKRLFQEEMKKRNHGKSIVIANYHPKYPESAEREYLRFMDNFMGIWKEVLFSNLQELKSILMEGDFHADAKKGKENKKKRKKKRFGILGTVMMKINDWFEKVHKALESAFGLFSVYSKISQIAQIAHKLTVKEWKKTVSKTLGIDLFEDYYAGNEYKILMEQWVSDNVDLIKTIPASSLDKMKEIVYTGYMEGESTTEIMKGMQKEYGISKNHARLIARDQMGKLNGAITKKQHQDAGIESYEWSTSRDERVRRGDKMAKGKIDPMGDNHQRLEGKIFPWNNPPLVDRKRGRRCHPGEDYQCRCCAIPVFDIDTLDLPV